MRPVRALTLASVLLATALTGCASAGQTVRSGPTSTPVTSSGTPAPVTPGPLVADSFQQRAGKLASAWDGSPAQQTWESGYVPLDETTKLPPDAFHSSTDKAAYLAGQFHIDVTLPSTPTQRTVHFDSGAQVTEPGIGADQALRTDGVGHCPAGAGCPTWLTVTGARATTERVRTSQGMATVPAWAIRIQGYQGEFVFSAVKAETIPKPVDLPHFNGYQGASLVSVSADGHTLTIGAFMGCGQQRPTGLVQETKDVVVIGATEKPAPSAPDVCPASAAMARMQVHLSGGLDGRTVLDVGTGLPQAPTQP